MAKQEITPQRSIRLTNKRGEGGRAVGGARKVITKAGEMSKAHLKRLAEKGDVLGMEAPPAEDEGGDLSKMKVDELRALAEEKGVEGAAEMKKADLLAVLEG